MGDAGGKVTYNVENGLAVIRMSRGRGNAINPGLLAELSATFSTAEADASVRGVLLASGNKLFCPGLDLGELSGFDRDTMRAFMGSFSQCVRAMFELPKPLVAAVAGHAVAGGCVLALTADWRVLARGAQIGLAEVRIGVALPFGVTRVLEDAVPRNRLHEVGLQGLNFTDEAAVAAGLVHELHDAEGLEAHALTRLADFATRDADAYRVTKRYLRSAAAEQMRAADPLYADEWLDSWFSEGTRRRIAGIVAGLAARKGSG